jgi:hypothetical protein
VLRPYCVFQLSGRVIVAAEAIAGLAFIAQS